LLLGFFTVFLAQADQPPCWCEFSVKSANKQFVAHIKKVKGPVTPGQSEAWVMLVFRKKSARDSTLLWQSPYRYDGYPEGVLSDDGENFAYVNYWYQGNAPVVELYHSGQHVASLPGTAFRLSPSKISATVSHQLWLTQQGRSYEFTAAGPKDYLLKITTIDGQAHLINCATGQFKK
jgi:hypothetical protein